MLVETWIIQQDKIEKVADSHSFCYVCGTTRRVRNINGEYNNYKSDNRVDKRMDCIKKIRIKRICSFSPQWPYLWRYKIFL